MMMMIDACSPRGEDPLRTLSRGSQPPSCRKASRVLQRARENLSQIRTEQPISNDIFATNSAETRDGYGLLPPSPTRPTLRSPSSSGMLSHVFFERTRLLGPEPSVHPRLIQQRLHLAWACDTWRSHHPAAKAQSQQKVERYIARVAEHAEALLAGKSSESTQGIVACFKEAASQSTCQPARIAEKLSYVSQEEPHRADLRQAAAFATQLAGLPFDEPFFDLATSPATDGENAEIEACGAERADFFWPATGLHLAQLIWATELFCGSPAPSANANL